MSISIFLRRESDLTVENLGYAFTYAGGYMKTSSPDFATGPTGAGNGEVVLNQPGRYLVEGKNVSQYGGTYSSELTIKKGGNQETIPSKGQFNTVLWVGDLEAGDSVKYVVSGNYTYTLSIFRVGG